MSPSASIPLIAVPVQSAASADSDVLDVVRELRDTIAEFRRHATPSAAFSSALTMTRASAKRRGLAAILSAAITVGYVLVDLIHGYREDRSEEMAVEERVDALEAKVDAIADDVAAIADALR